MLSQIFQLIHLKHGEMPEFVIIELIALERRIEAFWATVPPDRGIEAQALRLGLPQQLSQGVIPMLLPVFGGLPSIRHGRESKIFEETSDSNCLKKHEKNEPPARLT